jgi:hypothetical protein
MASWANLSFVSSCEIDQQLFHADIRISDEEEERYSPPSGPVEVGMEELIAITVAKRFPSRLSERMIQVLIREWRGLFHRDGGQRKPSMK